MPTTDFQGGINYMIDNLSSEQQKFAKSDFSTPCFSVAVAGSGKTTSCVGRIEQMIQSGINPSNILLLSFTKAAAHNILNRVRDALGKDKVKGISGGTFHSIFNTWLRRYGNCIGIDKNYTLYIDENLNDIMKLVFDEIDFPKGRGCPKAAEIIKLMHKIKVYNLSLNDAIGVYCDQYEDFIDNINQALEGYYKYCKQHNILDYDDILIKTLELIRTDTKIRDEICKKYQYIIVDEYQDTNKIQSSILYTLMESQYKPALTIVGDPNQSIYSFINSDINNILSFKDRFPEANEASLTTNFRSNQQILDTCNAIMQEANSPLFYNMVGTHQVPYKPILCSFDSRDDECEGIIDTVKHFNKKMGIPLGEIAILYRNSRSSYKLQMKLTTDTDYSFVVRGGKKFLETKSAQNVIQFLSVVNNTTTELSWIRTLTLFSKIGSKTAQTICKQLRDGDGYDISRINKLYISPSTKYWDSLLEFKNICMEARQKLSVHDIVEFIVNSYLDTQERYILERNGRNLTEELDKLDSDRQMFQVIVDASKHYRNLSSFLDDLVINDELEQDNSSDDTLVLSTIHSAKGLEWKVVLFVDPDSTQLPGLPRHNSLYPLGKKLNTLEYNEGRRLCYVACTRAKDYLLVFYSNWVGNDDLFPIELELSPFIDCKNVLKTFNIITGDELDDELNALVDEF